MRVLFRSPQVDLHARTHAQIGHKSFDLNQSPSGPGLADECPRAMTRLLAIEPNPERGMLLRRLLREAVRGEVTVVSSTKAALTALSAQTPDLILTSSLISP